METLWEKMKFWKKSNKMTLEENTHYKFVDFSHTEVIAIELLMEEYEGVMYHYHKVGAVEEDGIAKLKFNYIVITPGNHEMQDLLEDDKFHTIMGDILSKIILEYKKYESTGTNDPEELDLQ